MSHDFISPLKQLKLQLPKGNMGKEKIQKLNL